VFPPANGQAAYANALPHIVFPRRTLLWERSPTGSAQGYPWLALLLIDSTDPELAVQMVQLGDLGRKPFVRDPKTGLKTPSTLPANAVSYVDGVSFGLDYGQNWYDRCQAIDVPVALFNAIAPSLADLAWLGHARTIPTDSKAGVTETPGTFSVLIGNRAPAPNRKSTVHLVSLEGMAGFLPSGPDCKTTSFTLPDGDPASLIRLVSLNSWSFTSNDPAESFEGYLTSVDVGPIQRAGFFSLEPPSPPSDADPEQVVATAFGLGYTAFNHRTRQGDATVSWYRGPLVPFPVPPTIFIPAPDPVTHLPARIIGTADELVRYDPHNGLMDITYAAAWELGRLLALQSKSFSLALYRWRASLKQASAVTLSYEVTAPALEGSLRLPPPASGRTSAGAIQAATAAFVVDHLQQAFAALIAGPAASPAGRLRQHSMPHASRRKALVAQVQAALADPQRLAALLADVPVPQPVVQWLARLELLEGVPFNYLVPDEGLLPAESMRFFQIDPNWIDALVGGAVSVGQASSSDAAHARAAFPKLRAASRRVARSLRSPAPRADAEPPQPMVSSGFLLRSGVVAGWPGLEVTAFDSEGNRLRPLRMERPAATVLLYIAEGIIDHVFVREPPESMHFGVDPLGGILMRYVTVPESAPPHTLPGMAIMDAPPVPISYRAADVIMIDALAGALQQGLQAQHANDSNGSPRPFTSAEFALEMVQEAQSVRFNNQAAGTGS